jgi:putative cofactor-binding repeat protein
MLRTRLAHGVGVIALTAALLPAAAFLAGPAGATQFNVTSTADSGPNTLRQAIADAATNPGDDVIEIQAGLGTITITSEINWSGNGQVQINGNGATLSGPGVARGLVDDGGNGFAINGLTITGFGGTTDTDAAPVVEEGGTISLENCTITGNAIVTEGEDVAGGVLSEGGQVNVTDCTITGNSATTPDGDAGGGILSEGGAVILATSTVSGNTASTSSGDAGGGVLSEGGGVTVRTSTLNCNTGTTTAPDGGDAAGGINSEGGGITINGSTVVGNTATAVGDVSNSLLPTSFDGTGNTISDDTSSCAAPPPPPPGPGPAPAPAAVIAPAHFTG